MPAPSSRLSGIGHDAFDEDFMQAFAQEKHRALRQVLPVRHRIDIYDCAISVKEIERRQVARRYLLPVRNSVAQFVYILYNVCDNVARLLTQGRTARKHQRVSS